MIAKYAGVCRACSGSIAVGDSIEWSKECGARHAKCNAQSAVRATVPTSRSTPRSAAPAVEAAPFVRGEKWEPCRRASLPDATGEVRYVGATRAPWARLREGATGGLVVEGDVLIVVAQEGRYESAEDNEDMGDMSGPGWHMTLYLRRATDAEREAEVRRRVGAAIPALGCTIASCIDRAETSTSELR